MRPPVDHRCVKTNDHAVAAGHSVDPARWQEAFEGLMSRIAGRFIRFEPRFRIRKLMLGLLSDLPRKNCWTIAVWAGERTPGGMGCPRREVYGGNPKLQTALEERGTGYVLAVAGSRWRVEFFQSGKGLAALDEHQVRRYGSSSR